MLKVSGISKKDENGFSLQEVSFYQKKLSRLAIAGETGSGKSTLLKIIAGLAQADAGEVLFENQKVKGPEEKLVPGHPGIAYLSQQFELPGFLKVEQVLRYASTLSEKEAANLYKICRISHLLKRKTDQLSGGERQRIAFASLLSTSPKLLLLDEPFSNLDMVHKTILKSVIRDIGDKLKISCILVSHDPLDTLSWAEEILVLREGQIQQKASPEQIYRQPVNEYVAGLFGRYNLIPPASAKIFSRITGVGIHKKKLLIRPESFNLAADKDGALEGKVKQVSYFGSYYILEIQLTKLTLVVETAISNINKGDILQLSVSPDDIWYL